MSLDSRFSRSSFDEADDPTVLCGELRAVLESQLHDPLDALKDVDAIVRDLRSQGHDIYCWDDDGEGDSVWGDNYAKGTTKLNRLVVSFCLGRPEPSVDVEFGPWPLDRTRLCAFCGAEMTATTAVFHVDGHGSVNTPSVHVSVSFGQEPLKEARAGMESFHYEVSGFRCSACGGSWFLGQTSQ